MSSSNCCFLTCIQISQEAGQVVWYFHIIKNFPQFSVIHTVKGFDIVNKAEVDVFLELSCFFNDLAGVGNLISDSSAFSKPAWTSGSSRSMYCWSLAWRILSITVSIPNCCRNVRKMTVSNQNPAVTWTPSPACRQYGGRGLETKEAPVLSVAAASVMDSPQRTEKTMKGNQIYGLHPHTGAYIYPKKTITERHMHSKENCYCTTPRSQDTQPAPSPPGI